MSTNILVVDDYEDSRKTLGEILAHLDINVFEAESGKEALKIFKQNKIDIVYLDQNMPGWDGFKTIEELKKINPEIIVYFITGYANMENAIKAMQLGATDYLAKPLKFETIKNSLDQAISLIKAKIKYKKTNEENLFLGEHSSITKIKKDISLVAKTNYSVLICGESGTGKEVVASLIHKQSSRADKPFIPIHSGAIPDNLLESELFGFEKGAFTDAVIKKKGLLETADKGTAFLDEIGTLSPSSQIKILRVLQENTIQKIGSIKTNNIDVRFIFATNSNLEEESFRQDLYYRIAEFVITLPPLRERGEDVVLLAEHFLEKCTKELKKNSMTISAEAKAALRAYHWPGNIRELQNRIKRAVILCNSDILSKDDFLLQDKIQNSNNALIEKSLKGELSFNQATEEFEKELISSALKISDNNKAKAASILQMYTTSFCRKLKQTT